MNTGERYTEAWNGIRNGVRMERLAHAYIIVGSPRGAALSFTEEFLQLLYCEQDEGSCGSCAPCRQVAMHQHVDTFWLEPQSKSRQIKADEVRELIRRLGQTSFDGGWKCGVILAADCMNTASANILLKTLEEPPPRTLLLLLTDAPNALLPTIISRCQKIVLSDGGDVADEPEWKESLRSILHDLPPRSGLAASQLAYRLKALFDTARSGLANDVSESLAGSEETLDESKLKVTLEARTSALLKEVQGEVLRSMELWQRDIMLLTSGSGQEHLFFHEDSRMLEEQAGRYSSGSALAAVREVERLSARLDRNIPDLQVLDEYFRRQVRG